MSAFGKQFKAAVLSTVLLAPAGAALAGDAGNDGAPLKQKISKQQAMELGKEALVASGFTSGQCKYDEASEKLACIGMAELLPGKNLKGSFEKNAADLRGFIDDTKLAQANITKFWAKQGYDALPGGIVLLDNGKGEEQKVKSFTLLKPKSGDEDTLGIGQLKCEKKPDQEKKQCEGNVTKLQVQTPKQRPMPNFGTTQIYET